MRHLLHEMRTPLGQIIGYSEMLQEEMEDRGQQDLVPDAQKIQGAARKLLQLVEDVFQTSPQAVASGEAAAAAEGAGDPTSALGVEPTGRTAGGRLLLVDDEADNRDLLARRLTRAGYEVTAVEDGSRALHALE